MLQGITPRGDVKLFALALDFISVSRINSRLDRAVAS